MANMLPPHALSAGRPARLGATRGFTTGCQGRLLRPVPPGSGKDEDSRWCDVHEGELDEEQMARWIRQAAALPGWRGF